MGGREERKGGKEIKKEKNLNNTLIVNSTFDLKSLPFSWARESYEIAPVISSGVYKIKFSMAHTSHLILTTVLSGDIFIIPILQTRTVRLKETT